jgi:hypothetical protein
MKTTRPDGVQIYEPTRARPDHLSFRASRNLVWKIRDIQRWGGFPTLTAVVRAAVNELWQRLEMSSRRDGEAV